MWTYTNHLLLEEKVLIMKDKQQLLKEIMMYDFALQEASLFLDLHKEDPEAKKYYDCNKKLLQMSKQEYERYYGLLSNRSIYNQDYASYVETRWPWENEEVE
ncbi:MAG: spore coat protein CotJB [Erysipelotrichia bacterium]|nr:spore coat protein CotJB [Erysipelotrichia bacterium]NCC53961.1 spore coat protein CotJB [Erysipelotrichia bacterium]